MSKTRIEQYPNSFMTVSKILSNRNLKDVLPLNKALEINKIEREKSNKTDDQYENNVNEVLDKISNVSIYLDELEAYIYNVPRRLNSSDLSSNLSSGSSSDLSSSSLSSLSSSSSSDSVSSSSSDLSDTTDGADYQGNMLPSNISFVISIVRKILQEIISIILYYKTKILKKLKFYNIYDLQEIEMKIKEITNIFNGIYQNKIKANIYYKSVYTLFEKVSKKMKELNNLTIIGTQKVIDMDFLPPEPPREQYVGGYLSSISDLLASQHRY